MQTDAPPEVQPPAPPPSPYLTEGFWAALGITSGAVLGATVALVVADDPVLAVTVVTANIALLTLLSRFEAAWERWGGIAAVVAITTAAVVTGASTSPLRHLFVLPIVYVALTKGRSSIAVITALAVAARLGLLWPDRASAVGVVGGVTEVVIWLLLAVTAYGLRSSLGTTAKELDQVHQLHRTLVEGHRNAVYVLDVEGRFLEINPATEELSGYPVEAMIGQSFEPLVVEDLREQTWERFQEAVAGTPQTYETAIVRADGARLPLLVTNVRIRVGGTTTGVYGIAADLSSVSRDRIAREASERRFRRLADSASDGIYIVQTDRDGDERRFLYVNPALAELTGVAAAAWYADAGVARRHVPDEVIDRVLAMHVRGEPWTGPVELPWQLPDGEMRWLELREVPYEDDEGEVIGVQGIVHDITERVRRQEATTKALEAEQAAARHLRRVDDMKNAFLQSVSHELRTPLTSVIGLSSTVATHFERIGPGRSRELLERVVANAHKLDRLLSDLLDIDRMSRGVLRLKRTPVELSEVVVRVVEELEEVEDTLVAELEPVTVHGDGPKLERIAENLIHNALRHTPAGTTVVVRTRPADGGAELTVEDDGPGIDPELQGVLFDPFTQGPASATAANPGTGIGLTLVARFTELHGGTVTIAEREGGGASFRVWLPSAGEPLREDVEQR